MLEYGDLSPRLARTYLSHTGRPASMVATNFELNDASTRPVLSWISASASRNDGAGLFFSRLRIEKNDSHHSLPLLTR